MDELKRIIVNAGDVTDALQEMNNEIRQLDEEVNNLMIDVKQKTLSFCKNQKKLSRDAKTKAAKEIQATHNVIAEKSSKKMEIANKMYDFIDNKIQHLDEATSNFNKELLKKTAEKQNDVKDIRRAAREFAAANSSTSSSSRTLKKTDVEESARKIPDFKPIRVESAIPVNPNEPRYCVCNQVSFGEMIACDNPNCKYEWFHYQCLGIKKAPAGEFICKFCLEKGFKKKK